MSRFRAGQIAILLAAVLALAGCGGTGGGADGASASPHATSPTQSSDDESTTTEPSPTETSIRYRIQCFFPDARVLGDFSSLEETWASTNYLRIDHCVARYVGPEPFTLTDDEAAVAEIASSQLDDPGELSEHFLQILAACTRIGSEEGPNGFSAIPVPILEAALSLCPEAPQAGIIQKRIDG